MLPLLIGMPFSGDDVRDVLVQETLKKIDLICRRNPEVVAENSQGASPWVERPQKRCKPRGGGRTADPNNASEQRILPTPTSPGAIRMVFGDLWLYWISGFASSVIHCSNCDARARAAVAISGQLPKGCTLNAPRRGSECSRLSAASRQYPGAYPCAGSARPSKPERRPGVYRGPAR